MNVIQTAILKGKHISNTQNIRENSSWNKFNKNVEGKRLFLFGGTSACDFFLEQYGAKYQIDSILDNDQNKTGHKYSDYSKIELSQEHKELVVKAPEELNAYNRNEIIVIIASTNYYEDIVKQLEQMNVQQYYVLVVMEAHRISYFPYHFKRIYSEKMQFSEQYIYEKTGWNKKVIKEIAQYRRLRKIPIQKNKIVFMTFGKYMGHGKYIAEEILRRKLPYELVLLVYDKQKMKVPEAIRVVEFKDRESLYYELATAKMWISDVELPYPIKKRKGQIYIQTKHWAGVTLKRFYFDAPTIMSVPAKVRHWKKDFRAIDYMITGSDFDTETCRRGFRFKKTIWQIGSPRSDILFDCAGVRDKVLDYCQCSAEVKLLLYAPTYRFEKGNSNHKVVVREIALDYERVIRSLKDKFGGEWKILLRLHPAVAEFSKNIYKPEGVIEVSDYEDVQELVAVSDIMISDYSSIMFETAFIKRPVFLFTTDYEEYIKTEYDLLINISDLPFPRAENNRELCELITTFDEKEYRRKVESFLNHYGVKEDGNASKRAVDHIQELMRLA